MAYLIDKLVASFIGVSVDRGRMEILLVRRAPRDQDVHRLMDSFSLLIAVFGGFCCG